MFSWPLIRAINIHPDDTFILTMRAQASPNIFHGVIFLCSNISFCNDPWCNMSLFNISLSSMRNISWCNIYLCNIVGVQVSFFLQIFISAIFLYPIFVVAPGKAGSGRLPGCDGRRQQCECCHIAIIVAIFTIMSPYIHNIGTLSSFSRCL